MSKSPTYNELQERVQQLEKEVSLTNNVYKSLLRTTTQKGVLLTDVNGRNSRIFDCNQKAGQILGYPLDELLDQPVSSYLNEELISLIPKDKNPKTLENLKIQGVYPFISKDGKTLTATFAIYPVISKSEEIQAIKIIFYLPDNKAISDKSSEGESLFAKLFHNTNIGIAIIALDFSIIDVNAGYCNIIGYTKDQVIGKRIWDFTQPEILAENQDKQQQLAEGKIESYQMEKRFLHHDGSTVYALMDASLIRDHEGVPKYLISQIIDITQRKTAELSQKESRRMLETLVSNLPGMVYRCENTKDWRMVYMSRGCERLTGFGQKDLIENKKLSYANIIHEEDREFVWKKVQEAIRKRQPFEIEYRIVTASNAVRWMWEKGQFVGKGEEDHSYLEGFIMDITSNKEALQALRTSEENYRILAETVRDIICIHDMEGRIIYFNKAGLEYLQASFDEIKGRNVNEFIVDTGSKDKIKTRKEKRMAGVTSRFIYESTIITAQGTQIPLEISSSPIIHKSKTDSVILVGRDITERKESEKKLKQNEAWYRILFETTGTATIIFGDDKIIINCNKEFEILSGYNREQIEGKMQWADFVYPDDLGKMNYYHQLRSQNSHTPPNIYEFRFLSRTLQLKYIRITINKIKGTEFRVASFSDFTNLKSAQDALRVSEERLKLAIEGVGLGLWDWDFPSGNVYFNENWSRMLGYAPHEIEPKAETWENLVHPDDWPKVKRTLNEHLEGKTEVYFTEHRLRTKSGEYLWVAARGKVVEKQADGMAKRMVGIHNNISQRKEAELKLKNWNKELEKTVKERTAQLEETNKELETFSYSVSHDLKAPLRAITGFTKVLEEEYAPNMNEDHKKYLRIIKNNANKMNHLITDLLAFSKLGRKSLKLQHIKTINLIREAFSEQAQNYPANKHQFNLKPVKNLYADYSMLKIVFNNLISNALKFSHTSSHPFIEIGELEDSEKQIIYIQDNGIGFDMKYINKIFGAFQRLHKEEDFKGSGIGLSLVQRIINKHGGKIWADSQPGKGTTFYFYLSPVEKDKNIN